MLRMAQKFITTLAVTLGVLLGVASPANAEKIRIGYCDWATWALWDIAVEKGWFTEAGLDVELVYTDYVGQLDMFAAGKLHAASVTAGDVLYVGANSGKPATIIIVQDISNGNDMIIGAAGIDSIPALKGKKVGVEVGFVSHLLLLTALREHGMDEKDVELVNIPTPDLPNALASGAVDAIGAWQPATGQALETVGGSKALYTSASAPGIIYDCLAVDRAHLAANPEVWQKVTDVWFKVSAFAADPANKPELLRIGAARLGITPEKFEPMLDGVKVFSLKESIEAFKDKGGEDLTSVHGSSRYTDAFNVKYEVYAKPEYSPSYFDSSFTEKVGK